MLVITDRMSIHATKIEFDYSIVLQDNIIKKAGISGLVESCLIL